MGSLLADDASQAAGVNFAATAQAAGDHCLIAFDDQHLNDSLARDQGDGVVRIEGCGFHLASLVVDCV